MKISDAVFIQQGDCLELMKNIPDKHIDMILCDLPYGTTKNKWDVVIPFDLLWNIYERIRKNNCVVVLFGAEPFSSYLRLSNIVNFRYDWIWHKSKPSGMALSKKQPMRNHENISVFYSGQYNYIKEKREGFTEKTINQYKSGHLGTYRNHGDSTTGLGRTNLKKIEEMRFPTTIKKFASIPNVKGTLHPSQKPIDLLEYLIKTYTNEGDIILDNCAGSFSTGVACINTNRKFIGYELDQKYFEIGKNRLIEANKNHILY